MLKELFELCSVSFFIFLRCYLHARAQGLQVSEVQTLPAGVQTLHHAVRLHAAGTHRHPRQQAVVTTHILH